MNDQARYWNLHYDPPDGWRAQELGPVTVHGSPDTTQAVFAGRALFQRFDEALTAAGALSQSLGLQATGVLEAPAEAVIAGLRACAATYGGFNAAGMPTVGRLVALFTPHGTSLTFFGVSGPHAAAEVAAVVARMAASTRAGPPAVDHAAVRALAGRWASSDGRFDRSPTATSNRGVETTLILDGAGSFQYVSNSWFSLDVRRVSAGETPVDLGGADSSRSVTDAGQYTVIGREVVFRASQGQLVLPYALQGSVLTIGTATYARQ